LNAYQQCVVDKEGQYRLTAGKIPPDAMENMKAGRAAHLGTIYLLIGIFTKWSMIGHFY